MLFEGGASRRELAYSTQVVGLERWTRRPITSNSFRFTRMTVCVRVVNSQTTCHHLPIMWDDGGCAGVGPPRCEDGGVSSSHQSVPPGKSSHIAGAEADTGAAATDQDVARVIRITPLAYLGVFILVICVFFAIVGWPAGLWWLAAIPIATGWWVYRSRTVVSSSGLDLHTAFGSRHIDWAQLRGLRVPDRHIDWVRFGGIFRIPRRLVHTHLGVRAHLVDGTEVALPAVSYDRLRDLAVASNGRIPDPFADPDDAPITDSDTAEATETTAAYADATGVTEHGIASSPAQHNGSDPSDDGAPDGDAHDGTAARTNRAAETSD